MSSNLTVFWADPSGWPVEKPGYVFLARAMNLIGKALYPTKWTGAEPWAEKVPAALPEAPGIASKLELTKEMERAYRLIGKELPRPTYSRPGPRLSENKDAAAPDFGTGALGGPKFGGGKFGQSPIAQEKASGLIPLPQVVFSPVPALTTEEWAEARRRSIEIVLDATEKHERWWQVMQFTWRALVDETPASLVCVLRNDDTGKYEPTDRDWWNNEGYASRFGLCQLDKARPTKQRQFERGHNIRSSEYLGSDYRLIFVTEASLESALTSAKSLEAVPIEPSAEAATTEAAERTPAPAKRGAKLGQGKKPDEPFIEKILELERDGEKRFAATEMVALEMSDGTERNQNTIRTRLWRKVKGLPRLPQTDTKTYTK